MARKTRAQLKEMFSPGRLLTADDYHDLIDSMVNIVDDGINVLPQESIPEDQITAERDPGPGLTEL